MSMSYIVIMAGGSGSRMGASIPKQLLDIGGHPMIVHLLKHCSALCIDVVLVLSNGNRDIVINYLMDRNYIQPGSSDTSFRFMNIRIHVQIQPVADGTGGAIMATRSFFKNNNPDDRIVVLSADVPLISKNTITKLFESFHGGTDAVILSESTDDNSGYGRVITDDGKFRRIIEDKDCTVMQKKITLINTGVYAFRVGPLFDSLKLITNNNAQNEYYLTDCLEIINNKSNSVNIVGSDITEYKESYGANTPEQLEILKSEYMKKFSFSQISDPVSHPDIQNITRILGQLTTTGQIDTDRFNEYVCAITSVSDTDSPRLCVITVRYEDQVIGIGSILIERKIIHNMGCVGHIEDIVIDKSYRGQGIARRLIQYLIGIGRDAGCYKVILDASDGVCEFYEKCGFRKNGHCMRLDLVDCCI